MTKQELLDLLKTLAEDDYDREQGHIEADSALLVYINDEEITAAFEAVPKWYA